MKRSGRGTPTYEVLSMSFPCDLDAIRKLFDMFERMTGTFERRK